MTPMLPRLGMGTAGIGNLYAAVSDGEAEATLVAALTAGIGYFDTAPHYGFGLAESRLGAALARHDPDAQVLVSTKVGRLLVPTDRRGERHGFVDSAPFEPVFDYSRDGVLRSHDASRVRLRRQVDILLAHDLGRLTHGDDHGRHIRNFLDGGYPALRRLRDDGEINAIGIGVNEVSVCLELLDRVELDVILLAGRYTLLDRSAVPDLLARCTEFGTKLIIGGPYNSGILASNEIGSRFDYAIAPPAIVEQARRLAATCARFGVPLPVAALQFPLRHPQVASVIPGLVGAQQVADAVARLDWPVPPELWAALDDVAAAAFA